ncbi:beta family protein [Phytohabitans houttuyneae]|uniref:Beta protein n=1 Tax=Phytohabitans houttuyneae TaxID=1076126 RepID=A0A6V8K5N2_9ACTN|nr:beta family protein [Phytohabitans houttuyneae]GFJ76115.1 hypothetical protein Phou_002950 [Phytohabitans houttuyneae]
MASYVPILKGRAGEFKAIARLTVPPEVQVLPVLEVPPSEEGPIRDAFTFGKKAVKWVPAGLTIAVDVGHLPDPTSGWRRPILDIAEDLMHLGTPMRPVVRLDDSDERLSDAGEAAALHDRQAVVRLSIADAGADDEEAEARLTRMRLRTELEVEQCALVVDAGSVLSERDLTAAEPIVRKTISWARRHRWQSITVAAGAMRESISGLPTDKATRVRRWDHLLWTRLRDLDVGYGDYAIAHPAMTGKGWLPMPSLRYTHGDAWWIYRWARDGGGSAVMYDLCEHLVQASHWPAAGAAYSWGDAEINLRAERAAGTGNPTDWRAWATSHHLAHVLDQLRGRGG